MTLPYNTCSELPHKLQLTIGDWGGFLIRPEPAVCRPVENIGVGRQKACRRAPQGAKPQYNNENLPIEVKFSSGGMGHAALQ